MGQFIERYVRKIFYKKYQLDVKDYSFGTMYVKNGIVLEKDNMNYNGREKKSKRYCATNLMDMK